MFVPRGREIKSKNTPPNASEKADFPREKSEFFWSQRPPPAPEPILAASPGWLARECWPAPAEPGGRLGKAGFRNGKADSLSGQEQNLSIQAGINGF
jgi:hypothetical protein